MEQMKYFNSDEFEEILKKRYTESTSADLVDLIKRSGKHLIDLNIANNKQLSDRFEFISSVVNTAIELRKLSYKQWKALSAFCRDCEKELNVLDIPTKSF